MPAGAAKLLAGIGAQHGVGLAATRGQQTEIERVGGDTGLSPSQPLALHRRLGQTQQRTADIKLVRHVAEIGKPRDGRTEDRRLLSRRRKDAVMLDRDRIKARRRRVTPAPSNANPIVWPRTAARSRFGRRAAGTAASNVPIHCHDVKKDGWASASSARHSCSRVGSGGSASLVNWNSQSTLVGSRRRISFGTKPRQRYIRYCGVKSSLA